MKSFRTYLVILLALVLATVSALAWRQHQELIRLRALAAADESAQLKERLAALQKKLWALQDQLAAASGPAARDGSDPRAGPDGGPPGPQGRRGFGGRIEAMMGNPEFQRLASIQAKARLDGSYAALFKALSSGAAGAALTPEQLDQFKNLLVQKQQALMDAVQVARDQGLDPRTDRQAFGQAVAAAQAAVDQQIQAALGDTGYAAYQQYEQTMPQRNTVNQVEQSLSYTATPLTDAQANQLVQILAQDQPQRAGSGAASTGANLRSLFNQNAPAPITTQALTDAQGILSQPQLQALQQVQQAQQAQAQLMQMMRATRQTQSSGTAAAAKGPGG